MNFTDKEIQDIEKLSALNYSVKKIALYFNISPHFLQKEFDTPESVFRHHYDRGILFSQANIDMQVLNSAEKGNLTAIQRLDRSRNITNFINIRDQLINSIPEHSIDIKKLKPHNENS